MKQAVIFVGAAVIMTFASATPAQVVRFEILDESSSANDMTPDGRYVVGRHVGGEAYRWSREDGYVLLGDANAVAVSDDGTVVIGSIADPEDGVEVAGRWTEDTGWVSLGWLPDALNCPSRSNGYECSADGNVVVGLSWDGCSGRGFRWTPGAGIQELMPLANGGNRASVCSGDGNLIGGFAQGSFARTPAIWSGDTSGQVLDPPNGDIVGEVFGISDDGMTILGLWDGKAFRWDEGEEIELFDTVIAPWSGIAMDVADDGTIVGFDSFQLSRLAWVRLNGTNQGVNLRNHLESIGATGMPSTLDIAQAVTTDGHTIIGHNFFANGWMVNMCVPDIDGGGDVGFGDLLEVLASWGTCSGYCPQDLDLDGTVGFSDLLIVLASWGDCP